MSKNVKCFFCNSVGLGVSHYGSESTCAYRDDTTNNVWRKRQSVVGGSWKLKNEERELILGNSFKIISADWMVGLCNALWRNEKLICLETSWESTTLKILSAMIKLLMQWGWEAGCVNVYQQGHQHHALVSKLINIRPSERLETWPITELLSVAQGRLISMALTIYLNIFFSYRGYLLTSVTEICCFFGTGRFCRRQRKN